MFFSKQVSASAEFERRRAVRDEICLETLIEINGKQFPAVMLDVAASGFRARLPKIMADGTQVVVASEWLGRHSATAMWSRGREAGFQFQVALDAADLYYTLMQCSRTMTESEINAYVEAST